MTSVETRPSQQSVESESVFPERGALVTINDEDGIRLALGWLYVETASQRGSRARVAVMHCEPWFGPSPTVRSFCGEVERAQVVALTEAERVSPPAPEWFAPFAVQVLEAERARAEAAQARASETARVAELEQRHAEWVQRMNDDACEWAERNNLCSEFESFCSDWGLQGREREYEVEVEVTVRMTVTVSGRGRENAENNLDEAIVRDYLARNLRVLDLDYTTE